MPIEPPDPHKIAAALRDELTRLKLLTDVAPRESYLTAADLITRAIALLEETEVPAS